MPLLQVRECPEDIYRKITLLARKQNRTIAQQVLVVLEKGLGQEQSSSERRNQVLERIGNRHISNDTKLIDEVALIREDRDR